MLKTPSLGHCIKNTCFWYMVPQAEFRSEVGFCSDEDCCEKTQEKSEQ